MGATRPAPQYVALLRGINLPGKSTRVAMADLREVFEGLGFSDVRTLLNSGNVVFSCTEKSARAIAGRVQAGLSEGLRLNVSVMVLPCGDVAAAVRENPLSRVAKNPSWMLVLVPGKKGDLARLEPLLKERWAPEALAVGRRAAYLWCAKGVAGSPLWTAVDRALERSGTARNIATMTKLAEMTGGTTK